MINRSQNKFTNSVAVVSLSRLTSQETPCIQCILIINVYYYSKQEDKSVTPNTAYKLKPAGGMTAFILRWFRELF